MRFGPFEYPSYFRLAAVRGLNLDDCLMLIQVSDDPDDFRYDSIETFLVRRRGGRIEPVRGGPVWLKSFWISDRGRVFTARGMHPSAMLVGTPDELGRVNFEEMSESFTPGGAFGPSDNYVFVWGGLDPKQTNWLYLMENGVRRAVDSPGEILAMHGPRPDLIVAAGMRDNRAFVAWWNGQRWQDLACPNRLYRSVHVVSENEIYVGGVGILLDGSIHGLGERASFQTYQTITSIERWKDDLWFSSTVGLHKLGDGGLEEVALSYWNLKTMHAGEKLLFAAEDAALETEDGVEFRKLTIEELEEEIREAAGG